MSSDLSKYNDGIVRFIFFMDLDYEGFQIFAHCKNNMDDVKKNKGHIDEMNLEELTIPTYFNNINKVIILHENNKIGIITVNINKINLKNLLNLDYQEAFECTVCLEDCNKKYENNTNCVKNITACEKCSNIVCFECFKKLDNSPICKKIFDK